MVSEERAFGEDPIDGPAGDLAADEAGLGDPPEEPEAEEVPPSVLASMPETTATGGIFEAVDIERWLQDESGDTAAELRQSLQGVLALARREHWLVSAGELKIVSGHILGRGSFGVVLPGWFRGLPVAVKTTVSSKDRAHVRHLVSIANEVRILRHVRHPSIILFHGAYVEPEEGELMLVVERVLGQDLLAYVTDHASASDIYKRFQLLLDCACALRYLHAMQPPVIHGDLKDTNILVEGSTPRAKLIDFGLSRLLTRRAKPLSGTLRWMAPELICRPGDKPQSSADIFSLGRVAYLIITCQRPLEGMRERVVVEMARRGFTNLLFWQESKPLQSECKELCARLMSIKPEERPTACQAHQETSSWTLPDLEQEMPALKLAQAAAAHGGASQAGGRARLTSAAASSNFRQGLRSALLGGGHAGPQAGMGGGADAPPPAAAPEMPRVGMGDGANAPPPAVAPEMPRARASPVAALLAAEPGAAVCSL